MLYIAACGNEASVRKYLKEMEGEYVREDVQILCGDEIEGSGTMPDVLFLSESGIEECQKKIPVWFRRKAFDNAGELKQRKAGAERKRPLLIKQTEPIAVWIRKPFSMQRVWGVRWCFTQTRESLHIMPE